MSACWGMAAGLSWLKAPRDVGSHGFNTCYNPCSSVNLDLPPVKFTRTRHFWHERRRGSNLVTSGVKWSDLTFQLHCHVAGLRVKIRQTWNMLAPHNKKGGAKCGKFPVRNFTVNLRFSVLFVSIRIKRNHSLIKFRRGSWILRF
jgi:hypothetical protein